MQLQRCVFLCLLRFYFSGSSKSLWFINVCPEFRRLYLSATSSCVCLPLLQWFKLAKMIWSVINLPAVKSGVISVRVAQTRFHFCWLSSFSRCCCCFPPLVWARIAAGHFAAFSSSCRSYFDFCFSTEEALERRRRRQRLQALKYLKCGTDDGGDHSEWQQIRQLMLTIFYDIYILENCLCWFIMQNVGRGIFTVGTFPVGWVALGRLILQVD